MDNPLLDEIREIKSEHSTELAAFRAEILQKKLWIGETIFAESVSNDVLTVLLLNLIVRTVLHVVLQRNKSLSVVTMIRKTRETDC